MISLLSTAIILILTVGPTYSRPTTLDVLEYIGGIPVLPQYYESWMYLVLPVL